MSARLILTACAIACGSAPVLAHAFLEHAEPGAGATVKTPPPRVALVFSEKLATGGSALAVTDVSGRSVEAAVPAVGGRSMVARLRPLPPGRYRVTWHVVSLDAHPTDGAYSFTVKP